MTRRRKPWFVQKHNPDLIDIATAVQIADDADLPDGARMAMIESLTGRDSGEIADWLAANRG